MYRLVMTYASVYLYFDPPGDPALRHRRRVGSTLAPSGQRRMRRCADGGQESPIHVMEVPVSPDPYNQKSLDPAQLKQELEETRFELGLSTWIAVLLSVLVVVALALH
jgi:hypothetical protein